MRMFFSLILLAGMTACSAGGGNDATLVAKEPARGNDTVASPGKPLHPIQVQAEVAAPVRTGVENTANIVVRSARPFVNMDVEIAAEQSMVISTNRFSRSDAALERGEPVDFAFRFVPVSDEPQPVTVVVRATDAQGSVMTREVVLNLGAPKAARDEEKRRHRDEIAEPAEPAADVVVPARQEIKRGN